MALFGKADQDLPYLTQFRQVEPTEEEGLAYIKQGELYEFLRRDYVQELENDTTRTAVERDIYSTLGIPRRLYDQYLVLHPIVCRIMDALADDGQALREDYEQINEFFLADEKNRAALQSRKIVLSPPAPTRIKPLTEYERLSPHFAQAIVEKPIGPSGMMTKLLNELFALLSLPDKYGKVLRCDECRNSFIAQRRGQKWCSERCLHRAANRRSRAEKKRRSVLGNEPTFILNDAAIR